MYTDVPAHQTVHVHVVIHSATSVDGRIGGFGPDIERYYQLGPVWEVGAHLGRADTLLAGGDAVAESGADQVTAADIEARET